MLSNMADISPHGKMDSGPKDCSFSFSGLVPHNSCSVCAPYLSFTYVAVTGDPDKEETKERKGLFDLKVQF